MSGRDTTTADGDFSFTGLQASDSLVEVLSWDEVIASASVTLADSAMQVSGISVALSLSEDKGMPLAAKIGIGAGIGLAVLLLTVNIGICRNEGTC